MKWTHTDTSWVTKNLRLHSQDPRIKGNTTVLITNETETSIKWLLMTFIIIIERGLAHPSSAKVSLAENANKYNYPQPDVMQRE